MLNKHFAVIATVIFLLLIFHPVVVKAEQEQVPYTIDVNLQPPTPPGTQEVVLNNYGDEESVKTEIDVWEADLGRQATEGSYIGPLSESSVFEVDFNPLNENQPYNIDQTVAKWYLNPSPSFDWREQWPEDINFWSDIPVDPTSMDMENDFLEVFPSFPIAKTRSIVSVTQIVNFSNRVIMSGATEFWVKIPIQSSCINWNELTPTLSIIKMNPGEILDETKIWLAGQHKIVYSATPSYTNWEEYTNREQALYPSKSGIILQQYNGYEQIKIEYAGRLPDIAQPVTEKYVIGESIYTKIYGAVEPNTNYIIVFSTILNSKPKILITEDDLYNPERQSFIQISDITFTSSFLRYYESGIYEPIKPVVEIFTPSFSIALGTSPPNSTTELPIDMSFSFIFLSGRGDNGMYGQHFNMKKDSALVFYKTISPTTDQYISVMIPFISETPVKINVTVELSQAGPPDSYTTGLYNRFEIQGDLFHTVDYDGSSGYNVTPVFGYKSPYWWQSESPESYSDYMLFTIPYKVDTEYYPYDKIIRIMITFLEETNLTFMFSTLSPTDMYSQQSFNSERVFDLSFNQYYNSIFSTGALVIPRNLIRDKITYIYQDVNSHPIFYEGWEIKDDYGVEYPTLKGIGYRNTISNINDYEMVHAELFCSVQMTDGMWHQLATNANGFQYATNFFERRMAVGIIEYWVDTTNGSTSTKTEWYDESNDYFHQAWECLKKGDLIGVIKNVISGAVSLIWNGLKAFLGWIYGVFMGVWNLLCKVGQFIKTVLTNFVDTIMSIIDDIIGNVEKILNIAIYIVSIIIFAYVVSWIGRFIYITKRGLNA